MKRTLSLLLALTLVLALLPACRQETAQVSPGPGPSASAPPDETLPPPTPTPESAEGMALVRDALLDCCGDELAELGGYSVTMYGDGEEFSRLVEETYGIDAGLVTDGFVIDGAGGSLFEVVVLRMVDVDTADQAGDALSAYKDSLKERFVRRDSDGNRVVTDDESYTYVVKGYNLTGMGEILILLICRNAAEAVDAFNLAAKQYYQAQEESPTTPQPAPQPVEIGEGVYFIDISRPELRGEPDPDHPGRARYTQPNQEDMSIYDTSAILAAWGKGDPAGLSEYDRAIYDGAADVLETILQDGMDGFSKEAAIYEWVIQNVEYDWSHTDVMAETPRESYTPYGGLVERKAVCLGYATTFQLLMELAGIECVTVVGAAQSSKGDHAWNMVRLEGEWYCTDITWDQPYWDDGTMNGREWRYFNVTSDYMARTDHQWDYDHVPEATAEDHGKP